MHFCELRDSVNLLTNFYKLLSLLPSYGATPWLFSRLLYISSFFKTIHPVAM